MKDTNGTQWSEISDQTEDNGPGAAKGFFAGLIAGGFAGAAMMLLFAPKSGKRTRASIRHQYAEVRDQVMESIADAEEEALAKAQHTRHDVRGKMKEIRHRTPEMAVKA